MQRWPRTGRSRDPLQMRPRRLYFRPKEQIDPRELESGVGIRIRSRAGELDCPAAPSRPATPRPCMRGSARLAWQAGQASSRLLQSASRSSHRQTNGTHAGDAIQQVSAQCCLQHFCSRPTRRCCAWPVHCGGSRRQLLRCVSVPVQPPFWYVPPARATRISAPAPPLLLPPCSARTDAARSVPPPLQPLVLRSPAPARSSSIARTRRHESDSSIRSRRSVET